MNHTMVANEWASAQALSRFAPAVYNLVYLTVLGHLNILLKQNNLIIYIFYI